MLNYFIKKSDRFPFKIFIKIILYFYKICGAENLNKFENIIIKFKT